LEGTICIFFYRYIFTTYEDICYHKTGPWLFRKTIHLHLNAQLAANFIDDFVFYFWSID
jgi:hypothetical protein